MDNHKERLLVCTNSESDTNRRRLLASIMQANAYCSSLSSHLLPARSGHLCSRMLSLPVSIAIELYSVPIYTKVANPSQKFIIRLILITGSMLLREIIEQLEGAEEVAVLEDVSFRAKDLLLLREDCIRKYTSFKDMVLYREKQEETLIKLKEELCRIRPEALEEIERDCEAKFPWEQEPKEKARVSQGKASKVISNKLSKKGERKKRIQKILYS